MRLISQDRKIDIPYENSVVYIIANYGHSKEKGFHSIIGHKIMAHIGDDSLNLGDYSTEEKALYVLEMLQQQYMGRLTTILVDVKAESIYFRFPADEEL